MSKSGPASPSSPFPANASVLALEVGDATYFVVHWPEPGEAQADLTSAERAVLALLARGLSNAEIAAERRVSQRTVDNQVSAIFRKLGVKSRRELLLR
jgi:DNA-binding NarL/FixJ family response regulator